MDIALWLLIPIIIALLALSGFFSSSETALFSLSSMELEKMRQDDHPRISLIQQMLSRPRRLIITILIGNELVNVSASVISAAIVIELMGPENKWINLLIMVPLLLIFGEITPKVAAIRNNVAFASFQSYPIEFFARFIRPLRWLVRNVADWFITLIIGKERSRGNILTEDLVRTIAREAVDEGAIDHLEAQFIDHIFEFGDKKLEDVMTPRSYIFLLPFDMPLREIVAELCRTRHTKVPIYKEDKDNVVGILYARDLLSVSVGQASRDAPEWASLLREPYFVPESKPAADLFRAFRERKLSVAVTVDEYGGVTGLVTMEDLLECIFGEIHSPSDGRDRADMKELGNGCFAVDGGMMVKRFNAKFKTEFSDEFGETIGGLLLHHHGELPCEGATIVVSDMQFSVTKVEENRISFVEFKHLREAAEPESKSDAFAAPQPRIDSDAGIDKTAERIPDSAPSAKER